MYARVHQAETADSNGTSRNVVVRTWHSGRRRCFILLTCVFVLFVVVISAPIVGPVLSSVFNSNDESSELSREDDIQGDKDDRGSSVVWMRRDSKKTTLAPSTPVSPPPSNRVKDKQQDTEHVGPRDRSTLKPTSKITERAAETPNNSKNDKNNKGDLLNELEDYEENQESLVEMPTSEGEEVRKEGDSDPTEEEELVTDSNTLNFIFSSNMSAVVKSFSERCPAWSPEFRKQFIQECPYWISRFASWEQSVPDHTQAVAYVCDHQISCHGWGDRIAGIHSAFNKAMDLNRKFQIKHSHLKKIFRPCLFQRRVNLWTETEYRKTAGDCQLPRFECDMWNRRRYCSGGTWVAYQADRTCIRESHCDKVKAIHPNFNAVNLFGCGIRAMFEPSTKLMNELTFPFRLNGETKRMTLKDIHAAMAKYYVIVIHMRLGDAVAFFDNQNRMHDSKNGYYLRGLRCASTIESELLKNHPSGKINGKEVKFFLATDSDDFKREIWKSYGDKVMSFAFVPVHIAFGVAGNRAPALSEEIAEWLTIGKGDELIVNKVGQSINIYRGRVSGFSATSWLYHLKHMIVDASKCLRYSLPLDGIYSQSTGVCRSSPIWRDRYGGPQEHLEVLREKNLTFPHFWVNNGKIMKGDTNDLDDELGDDDEEPYVEGTKNGDE